MKAHKFLLPAILGASLFTGVAGAQTNDTPAAETQVEMRNEVPQGSNIDIDMPDAPDVNVTTPGGSTTRTETHTERNDTTIIDDNDDAEVATFNNTWLYIILAVLAILIIGVFAMGSRRGTVID